MESPWAIHRPCESDLSFWCRADSRDWTEPRCGFVQSRSALEHLLRPCHGRSPPPRASWRDAPEGLFRRQDRPHLRPAARSEEPTSELQSLMRISYAVFCLKKKKQTHIIKR